MLKSCAAALRLHETNTWQKNTAKVEATKNDQKTLKPPYPPGADEAKAVIQLQKGTTAKREKMYNMFYNYWTIKSHTKLLHKDGGLKPPARQKQPEMIRKKML